MDLIRGYDMKLLFIALLALSSQAYANDNPYSEYYDGYQTGSDYQKKNQSVLEYVESPEYQSQKQRHWQEEMQHQQQMHEQTLQLQRQSDCMFNHVCY